MLEAAALKTAIALIFAHLLTDFVLQTDGMVRNKHRPAVLALHTGIVALTAWLALGLAPVPWLILGLAVSHAVIDWIKLTWGKGFAGFALDQGAHLGVILISASLVPGAYGAGLWGVPALAPWISRLPEAMTLGAGGISAVWAGGYAVAALMSHLDPPAEASLPRGGRLIGRLERLMILILVLLGQPEGIGFLITAKSILRFGEVNREGAGDARRISEYIIIGTLASFAWALATATLTAHVLDLLRGS